MTLIASHPCRASCCKVEGVCRYKIDVGYCSDLRVEQAIWVAGTSVGRVHAAGGSNSYLRVSKLSLADTASSDGLPMHLKMVMR